MGLDIRLSAAMKASTGKGGKKTPKHVKGKQSRVGVSTYAREAIREEDPTENIKGLRD